MTAFPGDDVPLTINVRYSCPPCGVLDVAVVVPARGPEDVIAWLDVVRQLVTVDHAYRSPACQATEFHALKIPMLGSRVGDAPAH